MKIIYNKVIKLHFLLYFADIKLKGFLKNQISQSKPFVFSSFYFQSLNKLTIIYILHSVQNLFVNSLHVQQ